MSTWLSAQRRFLLAAFVVLTFGGLFALTRLPVSLFPTLQFPRIAVALDAGDRPADQMVVQVTRPAEEALRAIPGVRDIRSQTSRGSADISVTFEWGHDMVIAALQAESQLAGLVSSMPSGFTFDVRRMDPTIFPVLGYSVTSKTASQVDLRNFAQYTLRPLLASVEGVAAVQVLGGRDAEYQVLIDPVRLHAQGLSISDVEAALNSGNLVTATGRLEDRSKLYLNVIDDRLHDTADIGSIVLKSANGSVVELDDVADVRLGTAQSWTRVTADGEYAVLVNIRQNPNANSLALTDALKNVLQQESPRFPPGVVITPYYDQSELVRAGAISVRDAILIGSVLSGLVLFLFLRSARFVLVVALLLPAVLATSALVLTLLGLSLNIMTLGGMAAAVGLIVDDIIVMLEHVTRRLQERTHSVLEAAAEMSRPLIGSSLATILVFTPLAFLSGVTGGFFRALAITMAGSLFISMLFTLTVVPLMATRFARARDAQRAEESNDWLHWLGERYDGLMQRVLHHARLAALILVGVAALVGGVAAKHVGSGFMPEMDEGGFVLDYLAPPGLSLTETNRLLLQVEQIIRSVPEVASYSRRTGLQLGGGLTEANEGDMFIRLKPLPRRPIFEVMSEIRQRVEAQVPALQIETIQLMGDLIGDLTAVPQPIEVKFYGNDRALLSQAADQAVQALDGVQGVIEVQKSDRVAGDAIVVTLDRAHLALENLDPATVAQQVQALIGGRPDGSIQSGQRTLDIRVWSPSDMRDRVSAVRQLMLHAPDGHLVPLRRVAKIELVSGQPQISRENLQPMKAVTGRLDNIDMGSAMAEVRNAMSAVKLPAGVRLEYGGLYAEQQKSFHDLLAVFGAAFVMSALLMLFLFRDVSKTLTILGVVGISVAGVFAGLLVTGTELDITSMMGLTMVIGIIAELGVFYFAELPESRPDHRRRIDAGRARMRPILMSAVIAILALMPLALRLGQGAGLLAPMAIAIIFGLLVGAPMVVIAGPILHEAIHSLLPGIDDPDEGEHEDQAGAGTPADA